jgi:hypothetical protein
MNNQTTLSNWLLGLIGAVAGGAIGYTLFFLIVRQGLYAMVLPGALLGLGCGLLSGFKSNALGIVGGILALFLGLIIEWQFAPFVRDGSFNYFITHVHNLRSMTLFLIAVGGFFGYWFGRGREGGAWRRSRHSEAEE